MPDILWLFGRITPLAILDVLAVAAIIFWLLTIAQGTRALPLIRGVLILVAFLAILSTVLELTALRWLLSTSLPALLLAIPILFQPELRRALEQRGLTVLSVDVALAGATGDQSAGAHAQAGGDRSTGGSSNDRTGGQEAAADAMEADPTAPRSVPAGALVDVLA
ncbi:MAG: hypothetical protein M3320_08660 [Actinomycetota bacterium]|nr:hypothetical protein [Actinomycetota bacterium]